MVLFYIILTTIVVSLVSFIGVFTLSLKKETLDRAVFYFVALSVGGLMGGAFMHLLPESIEELGGSFALIYALIGFFFFLVIEKIIHWRHCHKGECSVHTFAYMNLVGDGIHNFIDGLIMATAFIVSPAVGVASAVAVILHEIPQEIGDFGVLIYGGISRGKALLYNFLTATTAIIGGIIGYYFLSSMQVFSGPLLAIAAGGFIYISASDLIPEIRKETDFKKSSINFAIIILGLILMYLLKFLEI